MSYKRNETVHIIQVSADTCVWMLDFKKHKDCRDPRNEANGLIVFSCVLQWTEQSTELQVQC